MGLVHAEAPGPCVTYPKGQQRSTYYLQLPYRYVIPLMILLVAMHFLTSQSIFLARLQYWDWTGGIISQGFYDKGSEDTISPGFRVWVSRPEPRLPCVLSAFSCWPRRSLSQADFSTRGYQSMATSRQSLALRATCRSRRIMMIRIQRQRRP